MLIDLYFNHLSAPSRAVLMTAKQLNIDLNIKTIDFFKAEHLTPEFIQLNPNHTVPTIVDDGFALFESRAIMCYLCNQYAPDSSLYPKEPIKRAIVDMWLNLDLTYFLEIREVNVLATGDKPSENSIQSLKNKLKLIDTLIGDNNYVAGNELTIADLSVLATTTLFAINDYKDLNDWPKLKLWFERMRNELSYFDEVNHNLNEGFKQMALKIKLIKIENNLLFEGILKGNVSNASQLSENSNI